MEVERLKPPLDDCGKDMVVSTERLRLFFLPILDKSFIDFINDGELAFFKW